MNRPCHCTVILRSEDPLYLSSAVPRSRGFLRRACLADLVGPEVPVVARALGLALGGAPSGQDTISLGNDRGNANFSENEATIDAQSFAAGGKSSSRPVEEIVGHLVIQTVLPVHPVGMVVVHPVNQ